MPEDASNQNLQIHEIAATDLEEVAGFVGRLSGSSVPPAQARKRLAWILLENPAREPGDPLGWCLRTPSGEMAGCMCCAPQRFRSGAATLRLMMANSFYVDERRRGGGTAILLKYLQLGRSFPLFVSSANATVAAMWKKLGGFPLGDSGHEVLGIVRWPPVLAEVVQRKVGSHAAARIAATVGAPWLRDLRRLLSASDTGSLSLLETPEEAAQVCAEHESDKITSTRDASFLKWRYFSYDPDTRLYAFRASDAAERFMIGVRLQKRGYRSQIRALHVLDIWGEVDGESCLAMAAGLWRQYRDRIDLLVFRCLHPQQREFLQNKGFRVRPFEAPIAWCLDKHKLLPQEPWYFTPADGDMYL